MSLATAPARLVGSGAHTYQPVVDWAKIPRDIELGDVVGLAVDADDRLHVFNRGAHPLVVFERDGAFASSWRAHPFVRPHGLRIAPDGALWCVDDLDHTVRRFTPDGRETLILGSPGVASDTGIDGIDYRTMKRTAGPFHRPTNLAFASDGSVVVADGYGNARIHRFAPDGRLLSSFGANGQGPGEFHLPHGIAIDADDRVYVADRENSRIQVFDLAGRWLAEWRDLARPMNLWIDRDGFVYVAEVGWLAALLAFHPDPGPAPGGRISVFDRAGRLVARWGGGERPEAPGDFLAPHDVCVDSRGDVYVGEVIASGKVGRGVVAGEGHRLQKFVRRR